MTNGSFPQSAQAVVVGGGIVGLSVLYHLARMGWKDIVLVEKNELTSGTTWHSAALVSQLRGTHAQTKLAQYSSRLYDELKVETGVETGMVRNGHFNLATSPDRLEEIKQALTLARLFGVEAHMVGRDEVERRWPLMNTDDVACALWTPSTGRGDPSNICQAFAKGARARGARIVEHVAVTGIARQNGRVSAVETSQGRIETPVVINCAGLWGREMAALAGLRAPLFACEHFPPVAIGPVGADPELPGELPACLRIVIERASNEFELAVQACTDAMGRADLAALTTTNHSPAKSCHLLFPESC